jgi:hypothetical protein
MTIGHLQLGIGTRIGYGYKSPDEADEPLIIATVQHDNVALAFFDV